MEKIILILFNTQLKFIIITKNLKKHTFENFWIGTKRGWKYMQGINCTPIEDRKSLFNTSIWVFFSQSILSNFLHDRSIISWSRRKSQVFSLTSLFSLVSFDCVITEAVIMLEYIGQGFLQENMPIKIHWASLNAGVFVFARNYAKFLWVSNI